MEWRHNPEVWWGDNQCCESGRYLACVGYVSGGDYRYGVWDREFGADHRVFIEKCGSIEKGKSLIEEWFRTHGENSSIELCDECWTRHLPGENDLCSK